MDGSSYSDWLARYWLVEVFATWPDRLADGWQLLMSISYNCHDSRTTSNSYWINASGHSRTTLDAIESWYRCLIIPVNAKRFIVHCSLPTIMNRLEDSCRWWTPLRLSSPRLPSAIMMTTVSHHHSTSLAHVNHQLTIHSPSNNHPLAISFDHHEASMNPQYPFMSWFDHQYSIHYCSHH